MLDRNLPGLIREEACALFDRIEFPVEEFASIRFEC